MLGKSTGGNPFLLVTISSPQNLAKAARYKEIARQMADPRGQTPQQIDALAREGRAVVLVSLGLHSTEVSSAQMGPRMVYRLATSNEEQIRTILDNTIFLLIPSFNPDGHVMVGKWVKKTAGMGEHLTRRRMASPKPWTAWRPNQYRKTGALARFVEGQRRTLPSHADCRIQMCDTIHTDW